MVGRLRRGERGIALLATLLAIALMTIIVMDFTTFSRLGYLSAANQANELRASYLARSAINVGVALLARDSLIDAHSKQPFDSLDDVWATPFPPLRVGGGTVTLSIVDAARKLDVNELVNQQNGRVNELMAQRIARLFNIIGVSPKLLPAIIEWLEPERVDYQGGPGGAYYLGLIPPYEPRHGPMPTIGDLRMVRGVNEATFLTLQRYLTVLPDPLVNVNTASPEVLASLESGLEENPSVVKDIIAARKIRPFATVLEVMNLPGVGTVGTKFPRVLTTRSVYFTITGMGEFAGARKIIRASFRRNGNGTATLISWRED